MDIEPIQTAGNIVNTAVIIAIIEDLVATIIKAPHNNPINKNRISPKYAPESNPSYCPLTISRLLLTWDAVAVAEIISCKGIDAPVGSNPSFGLVTPN